MEALDSQTGDGDIPMVEPEPVKAPAAIVAAPSSADLPAPDDDGQRPAAGCLVHPAPQEEVVSSSRSLIRSFGSSSALWASLEKADGGTLAGDGQTSSWPSSRDRRLQPASHLYPTFPPPFRLCLGSPLAAEAADVLLYVSSLAFRLAWLVELVQRERVVGRAVAASGRA
jgi:hypothetical protein